MENKKINQIYKGIKYKEEDLEDSNTLSILNEKIERIEKADTVYPSANIKIDREQYSIFELKRRYDKGTIILDPDFQRDDVWKPKQRSELIESVLMGIPLPLIYLVERKDGRLSVVDGRQRLTTFFKFLNNEFRLFGLRILTEKADGKKFNELDDKFQSDLEDFQLIVQIIKPPTPDRLKFDIFDRVNRGGTSLNNQEMRNALYIGKSTQILKELSENMDFKMATGHSVKPVRMKDRYIILRFLAFYIWRKGMLVDNENRPIPYKSDMEDFLGNTMEYLNGIDDATEEYLKDIFTTSMKKAYTTFGEDAFRIPTKFNEKRRPVSMTLFESLSYFFTLVDHHEIDFLSIGELFSQDEFYKSLTSNVDSSSMVETRFSYMEILAKELKNHDY